MFIDPGVIGSATQQRGGTGNALDLKHLVGDVLSGIWQGVTSSAWGVAVAVLFAFIVCVRVVHAFAYPGWQRDPIRRFSRPDKDEILRRAGGRCEHHG